MRIVTTFEQNGLFSKTLSIVDMDVQVSGPYSIVIGTITDITVDVTGGIEIKTTRFYQDSVYGIPGRMESDEDVVCTSIEELMLVVELEIAIQTMELLVALERAMGADHHPGYYNAEDEHGFAWGYGDHEVEDIWTAAPAADDLFNCAACDAADCGIRRQAYAGPESSLRAG